MRIGFFTYLKPEYGGGVAKYFTEVASGLSKRYKDLDLTLISFNEKTLRSIIFIYWIYFFGAQDKNLNNKETKKDVLKKLGRAGYQEVGLRSLKKQLQGFDLIYTTNNLLEVILIKYLLGYKNLPPVIYGFHIPAVYPTTKSLQAKLHNMIYSSGLYLSAALEAKRLHVLNSFDENWLGEKFPKGKVVKIYNPFDFDNFEAGAKRKTFRFNWNKKKFNILWVGRLTAQKGIDNLVEIIHTLNSSNYKDSIVWNITGEGELKADILNLKKKWDNVNYFGYVANSYLPSIYKNNDLFIATSSWESFPYNLLEAQSFGLGVVAFDIAGVNEIIDNNKNGYLVSDTRAFIRKVAYLSGSNKMEKEKIKAYIRNKFDQENIFKRLYSLFTEK